MSHILTYSNTSFWKSFFFLLNLPALEESDIEDGRVVVDELEEEHLEGETVFVLSVCPVTLCRRQKSKQYCTTGIFHRHLIFAIFAFFIIAPK